MFIVVEPPLSSDLKHGCNKPPPRKPQLLQRSPSLIKKINNNLVADYSANKFKFCTFYFLAEYSVNKLADSY
jgi:hypothetical protein